MIAREFKLRNEKCTMVYCWNALRKVMAGEFNASQQIYCMEDSVCVCVTDREKQKSSE